MDLEPKLLSELKKFENKKIVSNSILLTNQSHFTICSEKTFCILLEVKYECLGVLFLFPAAPF
jgi:hypothetical protein